MREARVNLAPLRFGAGVKGKISHAMMSGLPTVTTSIGAEGMDLVNEVHALIDDSPKGFAASIGRLLVDDLL
ncbi:glycosyltransferase, partial [bacterium]|nr:glycosyltransferase [bacterium]